MTNQHPGRPRKSDEERRDIKLQVRVTPDEYEEFAKYAKAERRTISNWILNACHQRAKSQRRKRPTKSDQD